MEKSYENYRTAYLAVNGNEAGKMLRSAIPAAVAIERALRIQEAANPEPDVADAPHDVSSAMRQAREALLDTILYTEAPMLEGMSRDSAAEAVSASLAAMVELPPADENADVPGLDPVDEFEGILGLSTWNGRPEARDMVKGAADLILASSRMDAGMRNAVMDCLSGTVRRKLSQRNRPSPETIRDAAVPAVIRTLSMCGMPDGLLPDRESLSGLLLSAFQKDGITLDEYRKGARGNGRVPTSGDTE